MKKTRFEGLGNRLEHILIKGLENGVFSGTALGIYSHKNGEKEKLIICHGKTRKDSKSKPVTDTTLFDLASLTKPLCTTLSILQLIDKKKLSMNTRLDSIFGAKTGLFYAKTQITELLSHSSGLIGYKPYYRDFSPVQEIGNKERLLECIFEEKPLYQAGKKCVYSDLGFILLGEVIEKVSGEMLHEYFVSKVAGAVGLEKKLYFRPVDRFISEEGENIAATQECPWRKRLLQGEVDDEHCWLMNGVAGHAGLFGSIDGVLDISAHILEQWQGRETATLCSKTLLQQALSRQLPEQSWCLGFDTPSQPGSSGGKYISERSVGHLGFTGTSFWIDPEMDLVIVLLTNRVHQSRDNEQIKEYRPLLHDTVYAFLHH